MLRRKRNWILNLSFQMTTISLNQTCLRTKEDTDMFVGKIRTIQVGARQSVATTALSSQPHEGLAALRG